MLGYAQLDYGAMGMRTELWHEYTGVRPAHQGRGIATHLKAHSISWARKRGVTRLLATNDEENAAMRGINARFGYVRQFAYVGFQRSV